MKNIIEDIKESLFQKSELKGEFENPILLVHGFADTSQLPWWSLLRGRLRDYDSSVKIFTVDFSSKIKINISDYDKEFGIPLSSVGSPKEYAEEIKDKVEDSDYDSFDIISHSMGGLASRWYIEQLGGNAYIDNIVTLGTPHQGVKAAKKIKITDALKEMDPESEFIKTLNSSSLPSNVNYISLYEEESTNYRPNEISRLPPHQLGSNARNILAKGCNHFNIIYKREAFEKYINYLSKN